MDSLESSAWTLAAGGFSVFAVAVVLKHAPWQVACAALVVIVIIWALRAPALAGGLLGLIAWACLTGFDVAKTGELEFSGASDAVRLSVLVAAGLAGWLAGWPARRVASGPATPQEVPPPRSASRGRPAVLVDSSDLGASQRRWATPHR